MITEFFYTMRFALAGIVTTAIYSVIFFLFHGLTELQPEISSLIAYSSSIILSYVLQSRFTFKVQKDDAKTFFSFLLVSFVGLVTSYLLMVVLVKEFLIPPITVTLIIVIFIPIINYICLRLVVFKL